MSRNPLRWAVGGVLALSLCLLAGPSTRSADKDDDDAKAEKMAVKEASAAVLKLMNGGGGSTAEDVAKKHKIEHVMRAVFKPRNKGGFGYGDKPNTVKPNQDGIESQIINIAKQRQPPVLAKEGEPLAKVARATRVLADINEFYTPQKKVGDRDPKDWKKYNDEMKKAADDLIDALKKSDAVAVKKAAGKLNQSCNECHGKFRDDPNP